MKCFYCKDKIDEESSLRLVQGDPRVCRQCFSYAMDTFRQEGIACVDKKNLERIMKLKPKHGPTKII